MIRVTRKYRFSASHRLHAAGLSDDENAGLYGKCNNPYGHGHDYEIEVSARGPLEPRSGRAIDPAALDRLVEEQVLRPFDHRYLNIESAAFQKAVPTTENLAREIYSRLQTRWNSAFPGPWPVLDKVRIAETPRNIFEVSETNG
ncbi:MAG: 6-pyruvoyl tetrahydrobiopterin synthase [Acidobacteria bacterium]|nr:MAG: 6-pyruvoyl tetrahydrobiopterin synthase [Acidobacteriota bacterium]